MLENRVERLVDQEPKHQRHLEKGKVKWGVSVEGEGLGVRGEKTERTEFQP